MLLDMKTLESRAKCLANSLSEAHLSVEQIMQVVREASHKGLPLKQRNNNFWAKYIMRMEKRNPTWDVDVNVELGYQDYR
jgi:hypothetical protein